MASSFPFRLSLLDACALQESLVLRVVVIHSDAFDKLGALVGAIAIFAFFALQSEQFRSARGIANWLDPASTLGIMAVAVALLMIGGHFDLSAGVMTGTTALTVVIVAVEFRQHIAVAIAVALVVALAIGLLNGVLVTRTGLPSFIITSLSHVSVPPAFTL